MDSGPYYKYLPTATADLSGLYSGAKPSSDLHGDLIVDQVGGNLDSRPVGFANGLPTLLEVIAAFKIRGTKHILALERFPSRTRGMSGDCELWKAQDQDSQRRKAGHFVLYISCTNQPSRGGKRARPPMRGLAYVYRTDEARGNGPLAGVVFSFAVLNSITSLASDPVNKLASSMVAQRPVLVMKAMAVTPARIETHLKWIRDND